MSKRFIFLHLVAIGVLYSIYWVCIYLAVSMDLPGQLGVTPPPGMDNSEFLPDFNRWSMIVMAASIFAAVGWYVIGQWLLRASTTPYGAWVLMWLGGLAITLVSGLVAVFEGPQPSENGGLLAVYYLGGGALFYYLASLFFSPPSIKFAVPGSKIVRYW